jgi:hypothetical protein
VLLHVTELDPAGLAYGSYAGLLGRGHTEFDPGIQVEQMESRAAAQLLDRAAARLARPCAKVDKIGRIDREVVAAAEGAELLGTGPRRRYSPGADPPVDLVSQGEPARTSSVDATVRHTLAAGRSAGIGSSRLRLCRTSQPAVWTGCSRDAVWSSRFGVGVLSAFR